MAGGGGDREVERAEAVAGQQQQLAGRDVLADRADMASALRRRHDARDAAVELDLLARDDGVVAGGQRVAGVDDGERLELDRRARHVGRPDGDAVHRRGRIGG